MEVPSPSMTPMGDRAHHPFREESSSAKILLVAGYRFRPTDAELVCYYLKRKIAGEPIEFDFITEIDLYKFAPWDLSDKSRLQSKDLEWYFFCPQERKYRNGSRRNRTTDIGWWKATGKDKPVIYKSRTVGMKKTLVFHVGKGPQGKRTDWAMYEYRLEEKELDGAGHIQDANVVCKIFKKCGSGPKIGKSYDDALFDEEDREDGAIEDNGLGLKVGAPFDEEHRKDGAIKDNGPGPRVGESYGAPFDEEDQEKDGAIVGNGPGPKIGESYGAPFDVEGWVDGAILENAFSLPFVSSPNPLDDQPILLDSLVENPNSLYFDNLDPLVENPSYFNNLDPLVENSSYFNYLDPLVENPNSLYLNNLGQLVQNLSYFNNLDPLVKIPSFVHSNNLDPLVQCPSSLHFNNLDPLVENLSYFNNLDPLGENSSSLDSNNLDPLVKNSSSLYSNCLDPIVDNASSLYVNNMHAQNVSIGCSSITLGAMNDPLPVEAGMINDHDQSTMLLEMEDFGRLAPQMGASDFVVDDDEHLPLFLNF